MFAITCYHEQSPLMNFGQGCRPSGTLPGAASSFQSDLGDRILTFLMLLMPWSSLSPVTRTSAFPSMAALRIRQTWNKCHYDFV